MFNLLTSSAMSYLAESKLMAFLMSHKGLMQALMFLDYTSFLKSGVSALKVVIIAVGGGLAVLGVVNLLEGYGNDNPGAKSQGMKQFMAGAGVMLIGALLVPDIVNAIQSLPCFAKAGSGIIFCSNAHDFTLLGKSEKAE